MQALLQDSHPAFYDQPETLITACPEQGDSSLLEFHNRFSDRPWRELTILGTDRAKLTLFALVGNLNQLAWYRSPNDILVGNHDSTVIENYVFLFGQVLSKQ